MKRIMWATAVLASALVACSGGDSASSSGSSASGASGSGSTTSATSSTGSTGNTGTDSGSSSSSSSGTSGTTASTSGVLVCPAQDALQATTSGSTGGSIGGSGFSEADHGKFPYVPNNGGFTHPNPVLQHVQMVTITFDGDPNRDAFEAYNSWIVASNWLRIVGADYGVAEGTHVAAVHLPYSDLNPYPDGGVPTLEVSQSRDDIETFLKNKLDDGSLPLPGSQLSCTSGTLDTPLYAIYYPKQVLIDEGQSGQSCTAFGGYHTWFKYTPAGSSTSINVPYAVLPTCTGFAGPGFSTEQGVEVATSHELIEAATDPFPQMSFNAPNTTTYNLEDYTSPWAAIPGEVGDLCVGQNYFEKDNGKSYGVQRIWSNTTSQQNPGGSPCIPFPSDTTAYINATPDPLDTQTINSGKSTTQTVTYTFTAWSDRPVPDFGFTVYPYETSFNFSSISFTSHPVAGSNRTSQTSGSAQGYQPVTVNNGDTITVTLTAPANLQQYDSALLLAYSEFDENIYYFWPIAVFVD